MQPLPLLALAAACLVGFVTAMVGVVTGGNSLVTVPALIALGVAPRVAVATNMFAVTFLALSGSIRFARSAATRWDLARPLIALTLVSSWLGARLLSSLDEGVVRITIAASMIAMVAILIARPRLGTQPAEAVSRTRWLSGMALAFVLGIYGGYFSGGYTTLLTFDCVGVLGASLAEAVALTKIVNFASSGIASVEFARAGLIDWRLGLPLAASMFAGAWLGASLAIRRGHEFLRGLMIATVALLAIKLIAVDVLGLGLGR